jgi:hypothetical protein
MFEPTLVLLGVLAIVVLGYLAAWRGKNSGVRRSGSAVVGVCAGLAAILASAYAVSGLGDFIDNRIPFLQTLLGEIIMSAIAIALWNFAYRSATFAARNPSQDESNPAPNR